MEVYYEGQKVAEEFDGAAVNGLPKAAVQGGEEGQAKETVTFFFHGYGSSINAEKHMAEAARKAGRQMRF